MLGGHPFTVDNIAFFFNYNPMGRISVSMTVPTITLIYRLCHEFVQTNRGLHVAVELLLRLKM